MKKVLNLVKKRQKSSQSSGDDRSTGGGAIDRGDSVSRTSIASSTATSSILRFQKNTDSSPISGSSGRRPGSAAFLGTSTDSKYNVNTNKGKDKSLSKLHVAAWKQDLEKVSPMGMLHK